MWKNVHPVYGAGIRTHNLRNVSLFPLPLDQGSHPSISYYGGYPDFFQKCLMTFITERNKRLKNRQGMTHVHEPTYKPK